jgi:flagellin
MSQVINTNVLSLTAQRNLNNNNNALQTSLERLSSGLRINSAKDDAAGLGIADRFTSQINGFRQASRNANDGISFSQTAEGALSTVNNNLQRIRELAVQSANATNTAADRKSLDNEVQQLIAEIGRVANQTEFNNQAILDGTLSTLFFQVGANQGQTIAVEGGDSRATELGTSEVVATSGATSTTAAGVSQVDISRGQLEFSGNVTISVTKSVSNDGSINEASISVSLSGITTFAGAIRAINDQLRTDNLEDGAVGALSDADRTAFVSANLNASLRVLDNGNTTIVINGAFDNSEANAVKTDNDFAIAAAGSDVAVFRVVGGQVNINTDDTSTDPVGLFAATGADTAGVTGAASRVDLTQIDVSTRENAYETIAAIDGALSQISGLRAELGAAQNRFEVAITNLGISVENFSAARSRIQDTDFAAETAELTRVQILQQAGTSVLAQANAAPQNVLALLQ